MKILDGHHPIDTSIIGESPVVIDGGAGVGGFAFDFHLLFPNSTIYCFEPNAKAIAGFIATRNVEKIPESVCPIFDVALGRATGIRDFVEHDRPHSESDGFYHSPARMIRRVFPVVTVGITSLLDSLPMVDVLKLDVEGAEFEIVGGLKSAITLPKQITLELHYRHTTNPDKDMDIAGVLESLGYSLTKYPNAILIGVLK